MSAILQADENGVLHLPPSVLPGSGPGTLYQIHQNRESLIVSKSNNTSKSPPNGAQSPEQRATAFRRWVESLPPGPGLSDQAVSRESIYD